MFTRVGARKLRRAQIDQQLAPAVILTIPRNGWIRELREALGLSARQLAERATSPATTRRDSAAVISASSANARVTGRWCNHTQQAVSLRKCQPS